VKVPPSIDLQKLLNHEVLGRSKWESAESMGIHVKVLKWRLMETG
jgi:hypothetical protein